MRDTLSPSWRAIDNPPAAFAVGVVGDITGADGSGAGTGADGVMASSGMSGAIVSSRIGTGFTGTTTGAVREGAGVAFALAGSGGAGMGAGTTVVAADARRLPGRSASITRRNGL